MWYLGGLINLTQSPLLSSLPTYLPACLSASGILSQHRLLIPTFHQSISFPGFLQPRSHELHGISLSCPATTTTTTPYLGPCRDLRFELPLTSCGSSREAFQSITQPSKQPLYISGRYSFIRLPLWPTCLALHLFLSCPKVQFPVSRPQVPLLDDPPTCLQYGI